MVKVELILNRKKHNNYAIVTTTFTANYLSTDTCS